MLARLPAVMLVALIAAPQAAWAWNALRNGDFSGGTAGWNVTHTGGGTAGYDGLLGSPDVGSLRLDSDAFGALDPATSHADQCVDVHRWFVIDVSMRKINDVPSGTGTHGFKLDIYDSAGCTGTILSTIILPDAGASVDGTGGTTWIEVSVAGTPLPSGATSAKMSLDTAAAPGEVSYYLVDDVQLVPPDEIFPDDFDGN